MLYNLVFSWRQQIQREKWNPNNEVFNVVFQEKNKGRNQLCSFYWGSLTGIQLKQFLFFFLLNWMTKTYWTRRLRYSRHGVRSTNPVLHKQRRGPKSECIQEQKNYIPKLLLCGRATSIIPAELKTVSEDLRGLIQQWILIVDMNKYLILNIIYKI